jgi:MoaA/NifB/PqqE/SkfB family radical SAM enzyme
LTARCDFDCFFCASGARLRDKSDMDFDLYKRLVKEMREAGVEELGVFYLGESFMVDWLADAIEYAKKECGYPYVFLTTNGRLATPERIEACMRAGLDSLKFSYNNADPKQFHEVTRVKEKEFFKVRDNVLAARAVRDKVEAETGHRCGIYASSIRYDGEQQQRMEAAVAEVIAAVDQHYWLPLYGQAGLTAGAQGTMPVAGNLGRLEAMRDPLPCWSLFTEGHVTFDGYLSACCFDHDGRFHLGDLKTQSFKEAWHSAEFQRIRDANLKKDVAGTPCEECIAYPHDPKPQAIVLTRKHKGEGFGTKA